MIKPNSFSVLTSVILSISVLTSAVFTMLCFFSITASAQNKTPPRPPTVLPPTAQALSEPAPLVSGVDQELTLHRVGVLPVTDNVDGIYARPVEARLKELLHDQHAWESVEIKTVGQTLTASELERAQDTIKKIAKGFDADALISARVVRNGNSVSITVDLFLAKDGELFLQEESKNSSQTDTKEVLNQIDQLTKKILGHMPYSGLVLSRNANRVTVNLGSRDGVKEGQTISAALIISLQRHPKFHFYVNSEKEIIGRIRVDKVEPTLTFGTVISERERGIIRKDTKILSLGFVNYERAESEKINLLTDDSQKQLAFGEKPREWVPTNPPTFGKFGFKFGLGSATYSQTLTDQSIQGSATFPQLSLFGELWINPMWILHANINEGITSFSNPLAGSSPSNLNVSYTRYALYVGYNFLLKDDFFGPKIEVLAGIDKTNLFVDASTPLSLTSTSYGGLAFGAAGSFPVTIGNEREKYNMGASLFLHLSPGLSETPQTSGASSSNSITQFSLFGSDKLGERVRAVASLDFDFYSTTFSGAGSRADSALSLSQRITTLNGGVEWAF